MRTIVIANSKGGVGKSTTVYAIAAGLQRMSKHVLICDCDPQGNTSDTAGVDVLSARYTLLEVFSGEDIQKAIIPVKEGLDVITAGLAMVSADRRFTDFADVFRLKKALDTIRGQYDYAVIDTSPFLGMMATSALIAADYCIIPLTADLYALQGVMQLQGMIANVRENANPTLTISGLLLTMYNPRTVLSRSIEDTIQATAAEMGTKVFQTRIRTSQGIRDSQALRKDIYQTGGNGADDYRTFVNELLNDIGGCDNGK